MEQSERPMEKEPQTEQEWADYYQAHKDDPDLWEEPQPFPFKRRPGRPSRGFAAKITVRFTPEEADIIRRASDASGGIGYSEVVRRAVLALEKEYPATESAAADAQNGAG